MIGFPLIRLIFRSTAFIVIVSLIFTALIGVRYATTYRTDGKYACLSFTDRNYGPYRTLFDVESGKSIADRQFDAQIQFRQTYARLSGDINGWQLFRSAASTLDRPLYAVKSEQISPKNLVLLGEKVRVDTHRWSPDWSMIAFIENINEVSMKLHIARLGVDSASGVSVDATDIEINTNATEFIVEWSPDSRYVVVKPVIATHPLFVWDVQENKTVATIAPVDVLNVQWSPDSSQLAFLSLPDESSEVWDLHVLEVRTGEQSSTQLKNRAYSTKMHWSFDSRVVALLSSPGNSRFVYDGNNDLEVFYTGQSLMSYSLLTDARFEIWGWNGASNKLLYQTRTGNIDDVGLFEFDPLTKTQSSASGDSSDHITMRLTSRFAQRTLNLAASRHADGTMSALLFDPAQSEPIRLVERVDSVNHFHFSQDGRIQLVQYRDEGRSYLLFHSADTGKQTISPAFHYVSISGIKNYQWGFDTRHTPPFYLVIGSLSESPDDIGLFRLDIDTGNLTTILSGKERIEGTHLYEYNTTTLEEDSTFIEVVRYKGGRAGFQYIDPLNGRVLISADLQRPVDRNFVNSGWNRTVYPYYPIVRYSSFVPFAMIRDENRKTWIELFLENQPPQVIETTPQQEIHFGNSGGEGEPKWSPDGQLFFYMIIDRSTPNVGVQPHIIDRYGNRNYYVPRPDQIRRMGWSQCHK